MNSCSMYVKYFPEMLVLNQNYFNQSQVFQNIKIQFQVAPVNPSAFSSCLAKEFGIPVYMICVYID